MQQHTGSALKTCIPETITPQANAEIHLTTQTLGPFDAFFFGIYKTKRYIDALGVHTRTI